MRAASLHRSTAQRRACLIPPSNCTTLHLGGDEFVVISIDRQKRDAVELFVYQDTDGTTVVEN